MYEIKDNSGSLFRNQKKEKDSHPNLTGSIRINGVDYWLSGWSKPTKDGKDKWISLAAKPKDERRDEPRQQASRRPNDEPGGGGDIDDEIPFAPEWR